MPAARRSPSPDDRGAAIPPRAPQGSWPAEILPFVDPDEIGRRSRELAAANAYILELEEMQWELMQSISRLVELAATDALTGLRNRRYFNDSLDTAYSLAQRHGLPLSMIMVDVDHFKQYNDTFGHCAGDDVLRVIATTLRESIREHDVAARYGGEEFAVLLIATDRDGAIRFSERLRETIASYQWPLRSVTISLGVATLEAGATAPFNLVKSADQALYQSKLAGRNRVTHHDTQLKVPAAQPTLSP
jgi:diguanylate cyclase (GGDEF)-like protein